MNPHQNSNQNPASTTSAVQQQVNSVVNQPMFNGGGYNMPVAAPPFFMSHQQPFPLQNTINGHFPNPQQNFNPFHPAVNQFNPQQQQQAQFFANNPHQNQNVGQQVLLQNTIQNICQLLQLQNPNYTQCTPPMFQNQIVNVNQPFLPGSLQIQQPHAAFTNFQNQIPQGAGPQNHNFFPNQMFGMANMNGAMQNVNQGQPGFVSQTMDVNASRQIGETHNPSPAVTNFEANHKNVPTGGCIESKQKRFTGHNTYDASHEGSKSHKHVKEKSGVYKGNMPKGGGNNLAADSVSRSSINFEKKVPSLNYTEQEIKEWRESRKKNYPTVGTVSKKHKKEQRSSDVTNQEAMLRRQQLKEILAKQAELGCEVADIPASYLSSGPREKKHERQQQYKKEKFRNKKAKRPRDQKAADYQTKKREPSLLQKLLTQDIKRDKNRLLQVLRFIAANSFLTEGESSLRFPSVVVRETNNVDTCSSALKIEEEEEGEIID